jgi:hypothetical protein
LERKENPIDFERLAFVLKAIAKDPNRPYCSIIHVEQTKSGSRLIASDGRRLHIADTSLKIKNGDYKPLVTKGAVILSIPEEPVQFPNWNAVIPKNVKQKRVIDLSDAGFGKDQKQTGNMAIALSAFFQKTGETVNLRYLEDLSKKEWAVYCQKEKGKALVMREKGNEDSVFAVIMPIMSEAIETAAPKAA